MTPRHQGPAIGVLALAAGMVSGAIAVGVQAQAQAPASRSTGAVRTAAVARTPDGHPDFQGVWANNTVTPLQRPKQWENKKTLTDAEIANLEVRRAHHGERRRRAIRRRFHPRGPEPD